MKTYSYCSKLNAQFRNATGAVLASTNQNLYDAWIAQRLQIGKEYLEFLKREGVPFLNGHFAEIGKGKNDSIALNSGLSKIKIITPYIDTDIIYDKNIVDSPLIVYQGLPCIHSKDGYYKKVDSTKYFMTHNPYDLEELYNWERLNIDGQSNVIIGVYGSNADYDKIDKIAMLEALEYRFGNRANYLYEEDSENYYCAAIGKGVSRTRKKELVHY